MQGRDGKENAGPAERRGSSHSRSGAGLEASKDQLAPTDSVEELERDSMLMAM